MALLSPDILHGYQHKITDHQVEHPQTMVFADMGLGKTIATLGAIDTLMERMVVYGVLIVAPLRVCQGVWRQEAAKWAHTNHLRFSTILGTPDERVRGLMTPADIHLINFDNLRWLQEQIEFRYLRKGRRPPFNMVVVDELSKMKSTRVRQGAERGKAMLKLLPYFPYRTGLTGTPASNGVQDLFGQALVIDGGQRLGTSFTKFRSTYFYQTDFNGYRWAPFDKSKEQIAEAIGDITINLAAEDYLEMPEKVVNDIMLELPPKVRVMYDKAEADMFIELEGGHQIELHNEASKLGRCRQMANGAIYPEPGVPKWEQIHDTKLDALEDIVEESAGQPVLVAYAFQHDAHKILKKFKGAVWLSSKTSEKDFLQTIDDWNSGKLTMIIAHPASMGHGIDRLQKNGHIIVWYGLDWSLDLYDQTNARLWRQGQERPVIIHRLVMGGTVDEAMRMALAAKAEDEIGARKALDAYRAGMTLTSSIT